MVGRAVPEEGHADVVRAPHPGAQAGADGRRSLGLDVGGVVRVALRAEGVADEQEDHPRDDREQDDSEQRTRRHAAILPPHRRAQDARQEREAIDRTERYPADRADDAPAPVHAART
jgi:hypothetical protein